ANLVVSNLTTSGHLAGLDGRDNAFIGAPRTVGMGANLVVSNLTTSGHLAGLDGRDNAFIGAPRTVG
ncbi:hypothetical protein C7E25_25480, partial [Stenotrophomonas maltophilia]